MLNNEEAVKKKPSYLYVNKDIDANIQHLYIPLPKSYTGTLNCRGNYLRRIFNDRKRSGRISNYTSISTLRI